MEDKKKFNFNISEVGVAAAIVGLVQLPITYFAVRRAYKKGVKDGWDANNNLWDVRQKLDVFDEKLANITKEMNKRPE